MTIMNKELTSDHIISYGRKVDGNTITVKFQFHPSIQAWLEENGIVPSYSFIEKSEKVHVISGFENKEIIGFREHEIKNSKRDIDLMLRRISVSVPLTKHQYKFMFPVFSKTPKLNLTQEDKKNLLSSGVWDEKIYKMNT